MGLIPDQSHLTVIDPAFETKRNRTYPGMAHFAESGPTGKTCRECQAWTGCGGDRGYYAKKGRHGGALKPRACARYREMMMGNTGPGVPHDARACKYFEQIDAVPSLTEKSA